MSLSTLASGVSGAPPPKLRRMMRKVSPFYLVLLEELGSESGAANQMIYLVTISRVLPGVAGAMGYRDLEVTPAATVSKTVSNFSIGLGHIEFEFALFFCII